MPQKYRQTLTWKNDIRQTKYLRQKIRLILQQLN